MALLHLQTLSLESTVEPSRIDEQLEFYREPEVMEKDKYIELPRF